VGRIVEQCSWENHMFLKQNRLFPDAVSTYGQSPNSAFVPGDLAAPYALCSVTKRRIALSTRITNEHDAAVIDIQHPIG
jgi:hypothetical protein